MKSIEKIIEKYKELNLSDIVDYDKFNAITVSHHSTKLEGSTLTELESEILLNNYSTPKGRPLSDVYMVADHALALSYVLEQAKNRKKITIELIQNVNALVLKNTGEIMNNAFGTFDLSKGVIRKWNVQNGRGDSYPAFQKVEDKTRELVAIVNERMTDNLSVKEATDLAFDMHYNLVAIHPFGNGNGRTSRLMMNYIQVYYNLPMAIVNSQDKEEYIQALRSTDETGNKKFFNDFMYEQYEKYLLHIITKQEENLKKDRKRGGFNFVF
ncbi:MAG: Fic family protein [Flavobacterium sp.]|uniref:Cell filamentation protein Fic n=1 Tax=Myroides odoratimimus TaxID=76832 RepID=A0AAI8G747_9FLAO|nr:MULTISPECIES: Fic family protein [Myroides]ALU28483.1 cell filamentation protein Fic [Myroides odoratimimus]UVD81421.1 Fic family protein [Myroides albus]